MVNLSVLIVDDDPLIRESMGQILNKLGISKVLAAENGQEAKNIFNEFRINLVFMDINLGKESGLDVLVELIAIDQNLFSVVLSGESSLTNVRQAMSIGAKSFVVKPYTQDKINEIIQTYLSKRS